MVNTRWLRLLPLLIVPVCLLFWITHESPPPTPLLQAALKAYRRNHTEVHNKRYIALIDYTKPIFAKRLWVVEVTTGKTMLSSHVSHALNSGILYATKLSNVAGSEMSCAGSFVTQHTYEGRYGHSLRVRGLEKGNSNTLRRNIVFHPNWLPFSRGCWMTTPRINSTLINLISGGAFVYVSVDSVAPVD